EPTYGGQLQDFSIQGHRAEGRIHIVYEEIPVTLADGEVVSLRRPTYSVEAPGFGALHPETMLSPRVASPMIGLGLLEAIDEADILALADPEDADGDGISGKANRVWSLEAGRAMLGRFGWKAGQPSLRQQIAAAFSGDIGIATTLFPAAAGDCTAAQSDCRAAPTGNSDRHDGVEASDKVLDVVLFYARNLAVPARREIDDPEVLAGKALFYGSGCIACHRPKFVTAERPDMPEQSGQLIWPYSDLLLHDMGEGLADHRPEGEASGREWRTPPLWGIGLTEVVNGHTQFLHDGRARNLLEAILWHGGEAEGAKQAVVSMSREERNALLRFLSTL
ncbi:MAG: c-type cytochrome, partial [Kiloniellales bacterium]|nr:c-type cytochrome [Kiloniellales bacterium]